MEWLAVTIGWNDAYRWGWMAAAPSPGPKGYLVRIADMVTPSKRLTPFANARLESLRLFGCMIRRGDARIAEIALALAASGMSEAVLNRIRQALVTHRR